MCGGIFHSIGHAVSNVVNGALHNPIRTIGDIAAIATGNPELIPLIHGGTDLIQGKGLGNALLDAGKTYALSNLGGSILGSPSTSIDWADGTSSTLGGSGILGSLSSNGGGVMNGLSNIFSGGGNALTDGAAGSSGGIVNSLTSGASKMGDALVSGIKSGAGNMFSLPTSLMNVGGNIFSAIQSNDAYKKMAQQEQGALSQQLAALAPYQQGGAAAQGQLSKLLGLSPESDAGTIQSTLENMPGYQFQLQQGQKALNNSLASRGMINSGAAVKEAQQFGQGLANTTYNDYINQLLQQSGQGQNATMGAANAQANMGNTLAGLTAGKTSALNSSLAQLLNPRSQIIWN